MNYWFVVCDLSMQLVWELHFLNKTGMLQIIYMCILLMTTFLISTITLLLLTMCLTLVSANILANMIFSHIIIFDEVSIALMYLIFM